MERPGASGRRANRHRLMAGYTVGVDVGGTKVAAALVDDALLALLARNRPHEIDAGYAAYDESPADQPDEWGDLDSWRRAASAS